MKYLSAEQRIRLIRLTQERTARRLKRVFKPPRFRRYRVVIRENKLTAPARIELIGTNARHLSEFLSATKEHVLVNKKRLTLDFRRTTSFAAAATLLLFAELDRIIQLSELNKPLTCRSPQATRPREVMKQIGLFQLTGDAVDVVPKRDDVIFWCATKGADQNGEIYGPLIERVAATVNKSYTDSIEKNGLWQGVSEAINNTTDHAYNDARSDGYPHAEHTRWWMFTHVRENTFTAVVCDLGIGYKRSVPNWIPAKVLETIRGTLLGKNLDSIAIQAAMKYGTSRTDEKNRGKGSRDALSVLTKHGVGELTIASYTGGVKYELKRGDTVPKITAIKLDLNIKGTLVWWRLPLGSVRT